MHSGLQAQCAEAGRGGFVGEAGENGVGHAPPARVGPDVHALDLGEGGEEGNPAAADRLGADLRHEEADIRLKQGVECQAVSLLGRVMNRQFLIEFTDERADLRRGSDNAFDRDDRGAAGQGQPSRVGCAKVIAATPERRSW